MDNLFRRFPMVRLAYLFGSVAKGRSSARSDRDIAILLDPCGADPLGVKLGIIAALQAKMGDVVDVSFLNDVGSVMKYQVAKYGQLLYERRPGMDKIFRINAWKEWCDFQPRLEFFYRRLAG